MRSASMARPGPIASTPWCARATFSAKRPSSSLIFASSSLISRRTDEATREFLKSPDGDDLWELVLLAGSLDREVAAALSAQEPAFIAKYAFELAQAFNLFYHRHHILSESDRGARRLSCCG